MLFYKKQIAGITVFVTPSDEPLYDPEYIPITQEEYEEFTGEPYVEPYAPPTNEELDTEQVWLRAQVIMLQAQNSFLENCLLEMADEVYA